MKNIITYIAELLGLSPSARGSQLSETAASEIESSPAHDLSHFSKCVWEMDKEA